MKNKLLIPNAPILIESIRSVGYSFESAMADIVDNSIGKMLKELIFILIFYHRHM